MKRNRLIMLVLLSVFSFLPLTVTGPAEASSPTVYVNGEQLYPDVNPYINSRGVTMVEMRSIFEALGVTLGYDNESKIITAVSDDGNTLAMMAGYSEVLVDGVSEYMPSPVEIWYGRTLVPLRFIGETLGADVSYDQSAGEIYINTY